jgi:hypothetical protein
MHVEPPFAHSIFSIWQMDFLVGFFKKLKFYKYSGGILDACSFI